MIERAQRIGASVEVVRNTAGGTSVILTLSAPLRQVPVLAQMAAAQVG